MFTGFQGGADLGRAVAAMDVLFNPSVTETFGNVTLEAMACGIPVLGVDAGGIAELIDRHTGLLVAPGSSKALAQGIEMLFACDMGMLGRQARASVVARYDWGRILPQIMSHYGCLFTGQQRAELAARVAHACE